ncbi:MAG: diguanylate cyclase [Steroidobacteraceae bacterium]|nr:diguanylate cyclase [Deltaproteobacteria bacterium]
MSIPVLRKFKPIAMFYLNLSLVISLVVVAIYLGIYMRNNRLLIESVRQQAVSCFDLIVKVRRWNVDYDGIYVVKKPGMESNRFLHEVGIEPDIATTDGRIFTLRNHAIMTSEISRILREYNGVQFRITSRQLLNKDNAPDGFELKALKKFDQGEPEFWAIETGTDGPLYRYMAPLVMEHSCQKCHSGFGYKVGDIRGGISVSIPFDKIAREMTLNRRVIIGLSVLTLALLLGSSYIMLNQLIGKIDSAQRALHEASISDELTGLRNRRFLMSRFNEEFERARRHNTPLGFLMMDLDHFKKINDSFGHPFGDLVLKGVAGIISGAMREYDVAARYGGEEFAVLVPETKRQDLVALAERIREQLENQDISDANSTVRVTVSIGVTSLDDNDTPETLLKRADNALYQAKNEGRNRTVLL